MKKGLILIAVSISMSSTMEIIMKLFAFRVHPIEMNFWRFALGALALSPFVVPRIIRKKVVLSRGSVGYLCLSGFVCVVLSMSLYQTAILYGRASVVAILFCCNFIFSVPLSIWLLGEKAYRGTLASIVLGTLGILCIVRWQDSVNSVVSCILVLLSSMLYAVYLVMGKKTSERFKSADFAFLSFVSGCAELLLCICISRIRAVSQLFHGLGLGILADIPVFENSLLANWPGMLYLGVCVTGLGYLILLEAINLSSVVVSSVIFYIKPVLATVLAYFILGEPITASVAAGIVLILLGSAVKMAPVFSEMRDSGGK